MDIKEQQIADLLRKNGLQVKEFTKKERDQSKTPDFRVFKESKFVFYCEVKTIAPDDWLIKLIKDAPPGTLVGGGRDDPIYNRLTNKIHDAVKQFETVNPNSEYPNVLAFVNLDNMCGWLDLIAVTTGQFLSKGGGLDPIYLKYSEGRIKKEKIKIHLYIWIDKSKGGFYLFNQVEKKHLNNLCSYFGKNPESFKNKEQFFK